MVLVSVSKNNCYRKKYWCQFRKNWYWKKYQYRFAKCFDIEKSIGINLTFRFSLKKFWYQKSFRFGFVQILGFVTHCLPMPEVSPEPDSNWAEIHLNSTMVFLSIFLSEQVFKKLSTLRTLWKQLLIYIPHQTTSVEKNTVRLKHFRLNPQIVHTS